MATKTLASLRADALVDADLRAGQISTTEVNRILNEELSELWELVAEQHQDRQILSDETLEITAGSDSVALPTTFFRDPRVTDITDADPGAHRPLPTFEWEDRYHVVEKSFCVFGNNLYIRPSDDAPGMYRMDCQYIWQDLASDVETVSFPNDWHRWASLKTSLRLRELQQMPTSAIERKIKDVEMRIVAAAQKRKGKRRQRDVRTRGRFWGIRKLDKEYDF